MTSPRKLAHNSALNLLGQAAPLIVALVTIPRLIRGFGAERFGILTLVWATIGYFGLFEFGLGRALTQSIAQRLGSGLEEELAGVARSGLLLLTGLGVAGAIVVGAMSPVLVDHVLKVPPVLRPESLSAFLVLAAALPFVLATVGLRGILEAHQDFGLATVLRLPGALITYLGPLVTLAFSRSLVPAIIVIAAGRLLMFVVHWFACLRVYPYLRDGTRLERVHASALLRFGAWTTVSNIVSPLMVSIDRFLVGSLLSLAAVTAYVTPYEAVSKLLVIPAAIAAAMLPALAGTLAADRARAQALYDQSLRAIMLVVFPVVLAAVVLAREGLAVWVGGSLPAESARLLQWLAVGMFVSSLAHAPATALQSAARADILARLHLVELPLYAGCILLLVRAYGLEGVAMAWTARATFDAATLAWLAHRRLGLPAMPRRGGSTGLVVMLGVLVAGAVLPSTASRLWYLAAVLAIFAATAWKVLISSTERAAIRGWLAGPRTWFLKQPASGVLPE